MATDLNKLLEELRSTLGKMEIAFGAIRDAIVWCDSSGTVQWCNSAFDHLVGRRHLEILGEDLAGLLQLEEKGTPLPPEAHPVRLILTSAEQRTGKYLIRIRDNARVVDVFLTRVRMENSGWGVVGVLHDITETSQLEREMAAARDAAIEAARLKAEFLANMSHEIRTPLNGIIGMTGLLVDSPLTLEQGEFVETIRVCGEALLSVINDILDFSKIEAGMLELEKVKFDVRSAFEGAVELLAESAHRKGLELILDVTPDVPESLKGDPGRLRQILINLVSNAIKFTEAGEVAVSVMVGAQTGQTLELRTEIRDTGIGISKEGKRRLFASFSQVDASTTRRFGGTGLGLAICKRLVETMQGSIEVDSVPGQGSTFRFTATFERQPEGTRFHPRTVAELGELNVLVVDDNQTNRRVLHHQLTAYSIRSAKAASGAEALRILQREHAAGTPFDLVILDMQMPGMDGLTLARNIRANPDLKLLRLLMMSSGGLPAKPEVMRAAGISVCLAKPVKQRILLDTMAELMAVPADLPLDSFTRTRRRPATGLDDDEAALPATGEDQEVPSGPKARILIAEDSIVNQQVAVMQLKKLGYNADAVANGLEALDALGRFQYDLILMDCQMPEMDGYQATREIRRREAGVHRVHIVAMTAHALEGDREKCLAAGMDDYISKPVTLRDLKITLGQWLGRGAGSGG